MFTYLGDSTRAGEECEVGVTARTRCWWVKFRGCSELLYAKRFHLRQSRGCLQELFKASNSVLMCSMVPDGRQDVNFMEVVWCSTYGETNMWSSAK